MQNWRANLLIFSTESIESMLDILSFPESTMGPVWLGPEKNCENDGSQMAGKRYFAILPKFLNNIQLGMMRKKTAIYLILQYTFQIHHLLSVANTD